MAETCICRTSTGLNRGLNHHWQKLANPALWATNVCATHFWCI